MTNEEDVRARHPGWQVWFGNHTQSWWACPPLELVQTLLNAPDLDLLDRQMSDVENWRPGNV